MHQAIAELKYTGLDAAATSENVHQHISILEGGAEEEIGGLRFVELIEGLMYEQLGELRQVCVVL